MTGKSIAENFDLVIGTSTGGIIALGIGLGIDSSTMLDLYQNRGDRIFPPSRRIVFLPCPRGLIKSKFRPNGLRDELESAFGDRLLGDSQCRLVVTAFNADDGDVKLIKTSHHERLRRDHKLRAVDVGLATSAAPTYFPTHQIDGGLALIDGGVWANCPALVGVIEAITVLGYERHDIDILSIGTTDEPFDIPRMLRGGGVIPWVLGTLPSWIRRHFQLSTTSAPALLMRANQAGALAQAELLTRRHERWDGLLRINPTTRPDRFKMDSPKDVQQLVALGRKTAEHHAEDILSRFLRTPVVPFVPVHGRNSRSAIEANPDSAR